MTCMNHHGHCVHNFANSFFLLDENLVIGRTHVSLIRFCDRYHIIFFSKHNYIRVSHLKHDK